MEWALDPNEEGSPSDKAKKSRGHEEDDEEEEDDEDEDADFDEPVDGEGQLARKRAREEGDLYTMVEDTIANRFLQSFDAKRFREGIFELTYRGGYGTGTNLTRAEVLSFDLYEFEWWLWRLRKQREEEAEAMKSATSRSSSR